jgi:hypothetical protein
MMDIGQIDTNLLQMMFSSPVASPLAKIPMDAQTSQTDFQSLLGLVDNMQLADEQSLSLEPQMDSMMTEVTDAGTKKLERDRNESAVLQENVFIGTTSPMVGLQGLAVDDSKKSAETLVRPQEMVQKNSDVAQTGMSRLDSSAVATWTTALASGDVKDVRLESTQSESLVSNGPVGPAPVEDSKELKQPPTVVASQFASKPVKSPVTESKLVETQQVEINQVETKPVETRSVDAKDFLLGQASDTQKPATKKESSFESQSKSQDKAFAESAQSNVLPFQGLKAAESLGEARDARISPQALSYVSDRVTELKAQGGGRMKVDLDSQELGAVELSVTVRGSQVNVEIKAERPEVQHMLNNSKIDLMSKIEAQGTKVAQVEVLNVAPERAIGKMAAQVERQKRSAASSEDVISSVSTRSAKANGLSDQQRLVDDRKLAAHEARMPESILSDGSDPSVAKTFESKDSGGFDSRQGSDKSQAQYERSMSNRDEQRQKDLETWQKKMQQRASA